MKIGFERMMEYLPGLCVIGLFIAAASPTGLFDAMGAASPEEDFNAASVSSRNPAGEAKVDCEGATLPNAGGETESGASISTGGASASMEKSLVESEDGEPMGAINSVFIPVREMPGVMTITSRDIPSAAPLPSVPGSPLRSSEARRGSGGRGNESAEEGIVDLNTAEMDDLISLPGIGPARAGRILSARPEGGFLSWDDVDAINGFGPRTIEMLMEYAYLGNTR